MSLNPFFSTHGIKDPKIFCDRREITEIMLNSLISENPQCMSIVGQRKIGKTSLVLHITQPEIIRSLNYFPDTHIFLYFNCQTHLLSIRSVEDFYSELLLLLREKLSTENPALEVEIFNELNGTPSYKQFERAIKLLERKQLYLIVLFDEFDKAIFQEELIRGGFFGSLRGYASDNQNFKWVTCTYKLLGDLFREAFDSFGIPETVRQSESDFFNIAPAYTLTLFDYQDARDLINVLPASSPIKFSEEQIELILNAGGNFPFFLQRACYHIFNSLLSKNQSNEEALQLYLREVYPFWNGFYNKLNTRQQRILIAIASGEDVVATDYEVNELIALSLIYRKPTGALAPFCEEFSKFMKSKFVEKSKTFQPGDKLLDRYEIISSFETNHSKIVKCLDLKLRRPVAIKFSREEIGEYLSFGEKIKIRPEREAEIVAQLDHPNIGKIFDLVSSPSGVVMEWIEGASLQEMIDANEVLQYRQVLDFTIQLVDAVNYLHKKSIIHRDIKPNNIIITSAGLLKLIDFDIARAPGFTTISEMPNGKHGYVGTPYYSAPEQWSDPNLVSAETDIFSLGIILYELITGINPFPKTSNPYKYADAEKRIPVPENPETRHIPEKVYIIICECLRQDPKERPSATDLKTKLEQCETKTGD